MCGEFGPKKGVINSDDSEFGLKKVSSIQIREDKPEAGKAQGLP